MAEQAGPAALWDDAYARGDGSRSWFQREPALSLRMLDAAGVSATDSLIDVGGGASTLVDAVLARGFHDVTVLDVSATGMQYARRRLGTAARQAAWVVADVLTWRPGRCYQVWHDRAVFHFLTASDARQQYMRTLDQAAAASAVAVFGCFAPDGPEYCSGLPVARYDAPGLASQLGSKWSLIAAETEEHVTPAGAVQPFTWAAFRRQGDGPAPGPDRGSRTLAADGRTQRGLLTWRVISSCYLAARRSHRSRNGPSSRSPSPARSTARTSSRSWQAASTRPWPHSRW